MRIIIFAGFMLQFFYSNGQIKDKSLLLSGILFFEKCNGVNSMYFTETHSANLNELLKKRDTIKVFSLGSPGDDANNVSAYKYFLDKEIIFDTLLIISIIEDGKNLSIEDSCTIEYKRGCINYAKNSKMKLKRRYEKKKINDKTIVYCLEYYIPIKSFSIIKNRYKKG